MLFRSLGVWQWGSAKTFCGLSVPAMGYDGVAGGGLAFGLVTTNGINMLQDSVKLPAGDYEVVMAVYNAADNEEVSTNSSAWHPYNTRLSARVPFTNTKFAAHAWTTDTISFTLDQEVAGRLRLGFSARKEAHAMPVVDWVKILRATPLGDADLALRRADLESAIAAANAVLGDAQGTAADELRATVAQAESLLNNEEADLADLLVGATSLKAATANFK